MNGSLTILTVVAVVAVLALGTGFVFAKETGMGTQSCDDQFKTWDTGSKGYLTYCDFQAGLDGTPGMISTGFGPLCPAGNGHRDFRTANINGDSRLSEREFCAWKNPSLHN